MGRYITGDIERKLWFGVQSSDAATRFGVEPSEPQYFEYYFGEDDLVKVESELTKIENTVGIKNIELFDKFFAETNGYNDDIMEKWGLEPSLWKKHCSDYADYKLGIAIRDCIAENDSCEFQAEM